MKIYEVCVSIILLFILYFFKFICKYRECIKFNNIGILDILNTMKPDIIIYIS